jgi:hypothetical protein
VGEQPAWSPDGEYVYAGGTSSASARSAPARSGCITRRARQRPAGHRAHAAGRKTTASRVISPDGRYLYYSKDVTPGLTFEYNKDPNGTIYAIIRRDLVTGRETRAVSVQGGSVTPRFRRTAGRSPTSAACGSRASCTSATSRAAATASCSATSTRTSRRPGPSTACTRSTPGRPTAARSSSGARGSSGVSMSRAERARRSPSRRAWSRR